MGKYKVSKREAEVIACILAGDSNREAAKKLGVTEKTIKFHLTNIYQNHGVKSRAQLIVLLK